MLSTPSLARRFKAPAIFLCGAVGFGTAVCMFLPLRSQKSLSAASFVPSLLTSAETSGPNTKLLTLTVPPQYIPGSFNPIWSVFIKDDDIQVERPYTPLKEIDDHGRLTFWIKRYPRGEVGRWLHSKNVGDTIEWRGPLPTWNWVDDVWDEVIMISGGTGITPFYQLFNSVINGDRSSNTQFTLLHSSLHPAELPPPFILQPLVAYATENPDRFRLQLFVDSTDDSANTPITGPKLQVGRIGKTAIERSLAHTTISWWRSPFAAFTSAWHARTPDQTRKTLFLICGPEPMVNAISGPHGRHFSQGTVGGILGEMGYTSRQVWKL